MTKDERPPLMIAEAAVILRVHRNTIQRLIGDGALPGAYRIGRTWRIPRSTLDDFIIRRTPRRPDDEPVTS